MSFIDLSAQEKRNIHSYFEDCIDIHLLKEKRIFELELPSNPIEWAASDEFLGLNRIFLNRGQYYAIRRFFQCYCPICSEISDEEVFSCDIKKLYHDKLLIWDWDKKIEYCPQCGITKNDLLEDDLLTQFNTMLGVVGMRAGKTMLASIIMTYIEQFMLGTENIKEALNLPKVPFIELACVAVSGKQAKDTIWAQYIAIRESTDWYKNLDSKMEEMGFTKDKLYDVTKDSEIINEVCGYKISGLHSSSASIAGRTRIGFVVDELGRFDTTESKRSASEIWRVGNNSLKTVRKEVSQSWFPKWLGSMIAIESPISVDDYGMKLLATSENSKKMFSMKMSTWEFNKEFDKEDFDQEFEDDFHGAQRDFGADPPGSVLPFITDWDLFLYFVEDEELVSVASFGDTIRYSGDVTYLGKKVNFVSLDTGDWFIAGDAGKSRDTFSLVGMKRVWRNDGLFEMHQGFAMHILPHGSQRRYVDYTKMDDLILALCEKLKVVKICFDYWNSETLIQTLQSKGLPVEQYAMSSLKVQDYFQFKQLADAGRIKLLPRTKNIPSPEDGDAKEMDSKTRQYWEWKRMQRSKDLKRVDHSVNSTSDLVECIVNCCRMATNPEETKRAGMNQVSKKSGGIARMRRW